MKQSLTLTIGLPRSGKSTWARKQGVPIVNPDSIRLALHGKPFIPESEGFVWAISYVMARALFLAGHKDIIIDATNITKKSREAWIGRFTDCMIRFEWFTVKAETCIKRARAGGRLDLIPIIKKMDEQTEGII